MLGEQILSSSSGSEETRLSDKIETLLNELKSYHVKASETDHIIPVWLPYIGVILVSISMLVKGVAEITGKHYRGHLMWDIGGTLTGISAALLILAIIAGTIISLYVFYKLIDRLNKHVKRTTVFYSIIADILDEIKSPNSASFKTQVNELKVASEERNPILWIILGLLFPPVFLYVYHFLNKDFVKHSNKEYVLFNVLNSEFKRVNLSTALNPEELYRVPNRSTLLYIILSIITLGVFVLYWIYTLVNDPNRHFKSHSILEKRIIDGFTEMISRSK